MEPQNVKTKVKTALRFTNPLTKNPDVVYANEEDLESLMGSGIGDNLFVISFFQTSGESNYVLNLHIDPQYNVRSVSMSNFFLKTMDKNLFRGWVKPEPYQPV